MLLFLIYAMGAQYPQRQAAEGVDKLERENYGKIKKRGIESGWGIVYSGGDGYFFNRMYE